MARPRHLTPSPTAIKRRAERALSQTRKLAGAEHSQLADIDDDEPAPLVPAGATTEESVRLRSVYDARKARLASLAEGLRLEIERGRLVPKTELDRSVLMVRDAGWSESQQIAGLILARLSGLPGEVRAAVKAAADAEVAAWAERWKRSVLAALGAER